ncbi:MAG: hypothetical protein ABW154_09945 [Dyella sp.]
MMVANRLLQPSLWLLLVCLTIGALLSITLGQDASWDLKNYHLYNAFAFLHGRTYRDLAAAGMQSFFNPLPDLPYYLLGTSVLERWPRLLAAYQGLWYGVLLFTLCFIATRLADLQRRSINWADVLAIVIGATGTMLVSQTGSSSNEVPLACLILLGVMQLLPLYGEQPDRTIRRALLAGLCCGLAVGLKPTAVIYPPAMALALLLSLRPHRLAWRVAMLYGTSALVGFVVSYGYWGWHLYQLTGNPIFPLFNQVFHSDWVAATNGTDPHFRPRDTLQWLFYPFYWLPKNQWLVTEVRFSDPRYALVMLTLATLLWLRLRKRAERAVIAPGTVFIAIFVAMAYINWMVLFSILRYAIPIEALSGFLILAALQAIDVRRQAVVGGARRIIHQMLLALLLVAVLSHYPSWGRGTYANKAFDIAPLTIEPDSKVVVLGAPQAYLAPFFAQAASIDFVGITWFTRSAQGSRLWRLTQARIEQHHGPLYALRRNDDASDEQTLHLMLPQASFTDCQLIHSPLEFDRRGRDNSLQLQLCRIVKRRLAGTPRLNN